MAQYTITVNDQKVQDMIDCYGDGYDAEIHGEDYPTKADFAKHGLHSFITSRVVKWKRQMAANALEAFDPEITID